MIGTTAKRQRIVAAPLAGVLFALAVLTISTPGAASSSHPLLPPHNPSANVAPVGANWLTNINVARSRTEGLAPLRANWARFYRLPVAEQLFALANMERVTRGLAPAVAMTSALNADSQLAAARQTDPAPATREIHQLVTYSSNWAQSPAITQSSLFAHFGWMYADGPPPYTAGVNVACPKAGDSGCWGHRDGILSPAPVAWLTSNPNCPSTPYMGAASARKIWGLSLTEAIAVVTCPLSTGIVATWPRVATTLGLPPSESGFLTASEAFHPAAGMPTALASDPLHVWALVARSARGAVLREWSASTGRLLRQVAVSGMPLGIADDGTNLWVLESTSDNVVEISGATGAVLATTPVGSGPDAISSSGGVVWVDNKWGGTITEIDAASGAVLATITPPVSGENTPSPTAIASDAAHVWVVVDMTEIDEFDRSGAFVTTIQVPTRSPILVDDGSELWVVDAYHRLTGVNEATATVNVHTTTPRTNYTLTACDGRLIAVAGSATVFPIHPGATGETLGPGVTDTSLASWLSASTCVGSTLWLGDQWNQSVDRVAVSALGDA
ncbi:MAG: YncE family protein [Acidimicrobiales bacterium]